MTVFPPILKKGGTIAMVAPSRTPNPLWIKKAKALLEKRGYKVAVHPGCYEKWGQLAGTDYARAAALMDAFINPDVDAIMCARGGTGANRMVDLLDYTVLAKHPKPFVGFSDVTVLLHAIAKHAGFVTYHGPMGRNFAHPHHKRTLEDFQKVLSAKGKVYLKFDKIDVATPGKAKGRLVGGNLCLLQNLIGTPYDWNSESAILFIEDVEEPLYSLDRALNHLRLAGRFEKVRAVIVGEMVGMTDDDDAGPYGLSVKEMVRAVVPKGVPLCFDFPCGHGKFLTTLPVGAQAGLAMTADGAVTLEWGRAA